jgi:hypothetical protein
MEETQANFSRTFIAIRYFSERYSSGQPLAIDAYAPLALVLSEKVRVQSSSSDRS